ncbi:MAG: Flp pilus assembly protein CpaB [Gaiellaceae bacterium]|jgi:pilus assembly protein CpaB
MKYRLRNILIALGLAIIAAVLVSAYVTQYKNHVQNGQNTEQVYVATRDIPAGTAGDDVVGGNYVHKVAVERRNVVPGAISTSSEIASSYVTGTIYQGEQLSARRFGQAGAEGSRGQLTGNQRAIEIDADPSQVLAGTLKTGDKVDVIGTWAVPEGSSHHVSRTVLRDILVLDAPSASTTRSGIGSNSASTITVQLRVTDTQANKLFFLAKNGEWSLALRPPARAGDSPETLWDAATIAAEGVSAATLHKAMQGAR